MFDKLDKYKNQNHFFYKPEDNLSAVCNAPTDKSGIYFLFKISNDKEELIYIGSSGRKLSNGTIKHRTAGLGGMKDRIVNGHQFGKVPRRKSWSLQMISEGIEKLKVRWWVTYSNEFKDFPTDVEDELLHTYFETYGKLPAWNKMGSKKSIERT